MLTIGMAKAKTNNSDRPRIEETQKPRAIIFALDCVAAQVFVSDKPVRPACFLVKFDAHPMF